MNYTRLKKYSVLAIIALLLSSCDQSDKVTIRGSYPDGAGEMLNVEMLNVNQLTPIDSVEVDEDGEFKIRFSLQSPELISVRNKQGNTINLLPFPGDEITLDISCGDFNNCYTVQGSDESEDIRSMVAEASKTMIILDSIVGLLNMSDDSIYRQALVSDYTDVYKAQRMHNIKFIVENITSLSSIYALYQRIGPEEYILGEVKDLQYLKIVADSVSIRYPNSSLVASLVYDVRRRQEAYNNALLMNKLSEQGIEGTGNIELLIPDAEGKEISLSSLQGKVVMLNFWASADQASLAANKSLKAVYQQYHSKGFEVYSVSLDNDKTVWRDAVRFEEYEWIDVCELTYPDSYAASIYNIQEIPTSFLIDKNGDIVAKNLNGRTLGTWLDNLLK